MSKIAIVFGSSTGATETVAEKLHGMFSEVTLFNAESVNVEDLKPFDFLIFGTSTTGIGELQDDWELLLPKIEKMDFAGKKVALFGLGDSASFNTSFAGGMYGIYRALKNKAEIVGSVLPEGYTFDDSESLINGRFVGLAIDEENESEKTDERLQRWAEELKKHMD